MTSGQLSSAEARYQAARRTAEQARQRRNELVIAALAAGWTHRRIAEVTGLTRSRISQIAGRREP